MPSLPLISPTICWVRDQSIAELRKNNAAVLTTFLFSLAEGIYVIGFSYPVVPKGKARIRVQISAAHTTEDIDKTVDAFIKIGKKRNVI